MTASLLGLRRLAQNGRCLSTAGVGVDKQPTSPDSAEAETTVTLETKRSSYE